MLQSFDALSPAARERAVERLSLCLAEINFEYLQANPDTPYLYATRVKYRDDSHRKYDEWCDIPKVLARGFGDCDDLAAWRIAELWKLGIYAMPKAESVYRGNSVTYHILVMTNAGFEDPSKFLGMP